MGRQSRRVFVSRVSVSVVDRGSRLCVSQDGACILIISYFTRLHSGTITLDYTVSRFILNDGGS